MKDKTMKKNSFVSGVFITTFGIFLTKILGIVYVIPFHALIGELGGALYGYAYTVYSLFISLATAGIPLSISKVVSEYQTLGYYDAKKRVFILGKRIAVILGLICFLILIIFAPVLARLILGDLVGGNSLKDVTFVIRVISTAILIVPVLSVYRGYFEGHRFMSPPSISQVLEQIVRVTIIILGSFLVIKVFHLSITSAVGLAIFGATAGALVSYIYLIDKKIKNKDKFELEVREVKEPVITNKMILKKIMFYSIPFIMIDIFKSLYNYVDMVTVVKGLVKIANFSVADAETIMSMLSTWCSKFNMIILAISSGVIVSLIPHLTQSLVKKNNRDIDKKVNQSYSIFMFFMIPMTAGISFLASPIWNVFYGASKYGPSVLSYFIFVASVMGLFSISVSILQVLKDYKVVFLSLFSGVIVKALVNKLFISVFFKLGLPAYYGVITATIIGYFLSVIICMIVLHYKYKINFEDSLKHFIDILCGTLLMIIILCILRLIVPVSVDNRILNALIIAIYGLVGALVYFVYCVKTKLFTSIFGSNIKKISRK